MAGRIYLTQADIRELQLAKGAVAAGVRILLERSSAGPDDLDAVYLAGAFGNYIGVDSAYGIGLLEVDPSIVISAGNTALRGAKMALMSDEFEPAIELEHVPLASDPEFQETFIGCLAFNAARSTVRR